MQAISPWTKFVLSLPILLYFSLGYVWASKGHAPETAFHPATLLDQAIPLVPAFIVFYLLGYVFVLVPVFMSRNLSEYYWGASLFIAILSGAFIIFKLFPVYLDIPFAGGSDVFSRLTLYQQRVGTHYNNFPSLHVALNVFCWLLLADRLGRQSLWLAWAPLLIVASTLLVKQHVLVDVAGGLAVGICAAAAFRRWRDRLEVGQLVFWSSYLIMMVVLLANWELTGRALMRIFFFIRRNLQGGGWLVLIALAALGISARLAFGRSKLPASPRG